MQIKNTTLYKTEWCANFQILIIARPYLIDLRENKTMLEGILEDFKNSICILYAIMGVMGPTMGP